MCKAMEPNSWCPLLWLSSPGEASKQGEARRASKEDPIMPVVVLAVLTWPQFMLPAFNFMMLRIRSQQRFSEHCHGRIMRCW
uniref:Uncharacterized protein n=1 Tax=Arundo donax TaxID=35708 RepID=A0A0A9CB38_ARUDO